MDQLIIPYVMFFLFLVTCLLDIVLIFCLGHSWELKGLKKHRLLSTVDAM